MSWDGIYAEDRHYPQFEPGDEVFTAKESWKAITANKPYEVVKCHKKPGMTIDIWVITLVTDVGYESLVVGFKKLKKLKSLDIDLS